MTPGPDLDEGVDWASWFQAAAKQYGWSHQSIIDMTPKQLFSYFDTSDKESASYGSLQEALAARASRREMGL